MQANPPGIFTLRKPRLVSACALTKMSVKLVFTSKTWAIRAVAAQAADPCRVLLVRRQRVEDAIAVDYASAELRVAQLLPQLSWSLFFG